MLFPHVDQGCVSLGVGVFSLAMKDVGLFATNYMGFVVLVGRFTSLKGKLSDDLAPMDQGSDEEQVKSRSMNQ